MKEALQIRAAKREKRVFIQDTSHLGHPLDIFAQEIKPSILLVRPSPDIIIENNWIGKRKIKCVKNGPEMAFSVGKRSLNDYEFYVFEKCSFHLIHYFF